MKKIANLRQMSNEQLHNRLNDIGPSLMRSIQMNKAGGLPTGKKSKDTMFIRKLKKEKARIFTLLRERELGINKGKK